MPASDARLPGLAQLPPRRHLRRAVLGAALALVIPLPAAAYLNPDSGSMLLQALVGGAAGVAVVARILWRRFAAFLRRDRGGPAA